MMTPNNLVTIERLIERHTKAQVELSWIGSQDPEDHDAIEAEAANAEASLKHYLSQLVKE